MLPAIREILSYCSRHQTITTLLVMIIMVQVNSKAFSNFIIFIYLFVGLMLKVVGGLQVQYQETNIKAIETLKPFC